MDISNHMMMFLAIMNILKDRKEIIDELINTDNMKPLNDENGTSVTEDKLIKKTKIIENSPFIIEVISWEDETGNCYKKQLNLKYNENDINILKEKLNEAIENEDYETASIIRDKIKEVENKNNIN